MQVTTDDQWYSFTHGHELTETQKEDYDWIEDIDASVFVQCSDYIYSVSEFIRFDSNQPPELKDYDAYLSDSAFSGVVIKVSSCGDFYKIATHISRSD